MAKQEILKLLREAAEKAEVELTKEVNDLGSYGLALALLNRLNSTYTRKLAKSVKAIHDAIDAVNQMD